jgi:hypothetical protein
MPFHAERLVVRFQPHAPPARKERLSAWSQYDGSAKTLVVWFNNHNIGVKRYNDVIELAIEVVSGAS